MRLEAFAKINWTLDITGVRDDGYHIMDMVMQPVSLSDEIILAPSESLCISTAGFYSSPADSSNLAFRAAMALRLACGINKGVAIHIDKRIPVGAGMGGGSSDAAAVLTGLNLLWHTNLSAKELESIGLTIGADVPFCLRGGLNRTTGIGEAMTGYPFKSNWWLLVFQPCRGLSTRKIFEAWTSKEIMHPDNNTVLEGLRTGDLDLVHQGIANVLEPVSSALCPQIREAVRDLENNGARVASMTGSGSAVFGVFISRTEAERARDRLMKKWPRVHLCHTQSESIRVLEE